VTRQPNILVGGKLKTTELKVCSGWLISLYDNRINGILADEMVSYISFHFRKDKTLADILSKGFGKTIQKTSLIAFLIQSKRQRGPYLVIVPLSTIMTNWSGEFAKWAPSVRMIAYM